MEMFAHMRHQIAALEARINEALGPMSDRMDAGHGGAPAARAGASHYGSVEAPMDGHGASDTELRPAMPARRTALSQRRPGWLAANTASGEQMEQWRQTSASPIAGSDRDEEEAERFTDNTSDTWQHRPVASSRRSGTHRPLFGAQPEPEGMPAPVDRDSALNQQREQDVAANLTANARVETQLNEDGRKTAFQNVR
jgi:hypothetical protein